jgi:predicted DNA-binding protein (UPF0251 family)
MNTHADRKFERKNQAVMNPVTQKQIDSESKFKFLDNRPEAIAQRKLIEIANHSPQVNQLKAIQQMAKNIPQEAHLKVMLKQNTSTPIQDIKDYGITQLSHNQKDVTNPGVVIQRVGEDTLEETVSSNETDIETMQRNEKYYLRFALELRKMVKREIPEEEMISIWERFSLAMKRHEILLPNWGETDWGKVEARKKEVDTTEIQLAKLEAFREDIQFLTELIETEQGEELQVNNVTLWRNIEIGRTAANNEDLNEKMGVTNGGTPMNRTSMGALLDLFAVGSTDGSNADLENVNGDLLLANKNPYMQWGGSFNFWSAVSANFAAKATGDVHVYVPTGTGTGSVFWMAELPELRKNPKVRNIFIHELSAKGREAVAKRKADILNQLELNTILNSPIAWTTSEISGLTVTGAGGVKGVSAGRLEDIGNKWNNKAKRNKAKRSQME